MKNDSNSYLMYKDEVFSIKEIKLAIVRQQNYINFLDEKISKGMRDMTYLKKARKKGVMELKEFEDNLKEV